MRHGRRTASIAGQAIRGRAYAREVQKLIVENQTDWLTPVATLLAVLIGGWVSWLVQRLHAKRREAGEAKASARVLQGDLAMQASRLKDMVVDDPRWFGFYDLRLPAWDRHAAVVALHLDAIDWEMVSQSAMELAGLTDGMERALGPGGPHEGKRVIGLSPKQQSSYRKLWENATLAYNALAPLAGTAREPKLLHEGAPAAS